VWWEIQYRFYYNFPQVYHCQKLSKLAQDRQSYWKNKKGAVFLKHSVHTASFDEVITKEKREYELSAQSVYEWFCLDSVLELHFSCFKCILCL